MEDDHNEPPFTLEVAKEWLHHLEDRAWSANSTAGALEFILCNLLIELHRGEPFDGAAFTQRLLALSQHLPSPAQIGTQVILEHLSHELSLARTGGTKGYVLH